MFCFLALASMSSRIVRGAEASDSMVFMGDAHLAMEPLVKGVPLDEEDLVPQLVDIIVEHFGGTRKGKSTGFRASVKNFFGGVFA